MNLYNGNITQMVSTLPNVINYQNNQTITPQPLATTYRYDQLNRLTEVKAFENYNTLSNVNTWALNNQTGTNAYHEQFTYDANGNIKNVKRNGNLLGPAQAMDDLTYEYNTQIIGGVQRLVNNKLNSVSDAVSASNYTEDVDNQSLLNYGYDAIGNLVRDDAENIQEIKWNAYGKISSITRTGNNNKSNLEFGYDASGQRLWKTVKPRVNGVQSTQKDWTTTYYVRDATGNVMATYSQTYTDLQSNQIKEEIKLKELHLYGSSRLGIYNLDQVMATQEYNISGYNSNGTFVNPSVMFNTLVTTEVSPLPTIFTVYKGNKQYELSNHLGNVLATISDRRVPRDDNGDLLIDYFNADILSTSDYYAFGSAINTRSYVASTKYRYGFNTQEKDDELAGDNNSYTAEFWQYDGRLGRRFNLDPRPNQSISSYACFQNNPLVLSDEYGDSSEYYSEAGKLLYVSHDNLENGIVIIPNSKIKEFEKFKNSLFEKTNVNPQNFETKEESMKLRSFGVVYIINDYLNAFKNTYKKTPDISDLKDVKDSKGKKVTLYSEYGADIVLIGNEARIGNLYTSGFYDALFQSDNPGTSGNVISHFHTHPTKKGHYTASRKGNKVSFFVSPDHASTQDCSDNPQYFELIVSHKVIILNKGFQEIIIDRSKLFKYVVR